MVLPMTTIKRSKAFQAIPRKVETLKPGQVRCPVCRKGVKRRSNGTLYRHNDVNARCDSTAVRVGYVYRGTGVDTIAVSA